MDMLSPDFLCPLLTLNHSSSAIFQNVCGEHMRSTRMSRVNLLRRLRSSIYSKKSPHKYTVPRSLDLAKIPVITIKSSPLPVNSLAAGKFEWNFIYVIFKRNLVIYGWGICCEIALIWMSLDLTDDQSTLVQVMAWCRYATSHYLSQFWPRSLSPYGVTRPQWVNSLWPGNRMWWQRSGSILLTSGLTAPSHYLNQWWLIISKVQ